MGVIMTPKQRILPASRLWLLPTSYSKESTWYLDCPTLPGSAEKKKGVPWAQRPPYDPGLPGVVEGRNCNTGHSTPAVHHLGQNSPDIFFGSVQEFHECLALVGEEGDLFNMQKVI